MRTFYFLTIAVLWGASAIVTNNQAVSGAPEVSVGYRMAIVSLLMFGWRLAAGKPIALPQGGCIWIAMQGVLFFGLSFIAFYYATRFLPSGVAALILSSSSLIAAAAGWIFLKRPFNARLLGALACGVLGLGVIVAPQVSDLTTTDGVRTGMALALAAAASTALGTLIADRNQRTGLEISALMGWSALAGAGFAFLWALVHGADFRVNLTPTYMAGMFYLSVFASCITFFMYFSLVKKVGPASASYTLSAVPLVAILLSALFEGLKLDANLVLGALFICVGNVLVVRFSSPPRPAPRLNGEEQAAHS